MNKPHPHDYALVAGAVMMALVFLWAYSRLKTIASSNDRLKLFQRVAVINGSILLATIMTFIIMR